MRKVTLSALLLLSVTCLVSVAAEKAGASVSNAVNNAAGDAANSFIRSIAEYYVAPQKEVIVVRERSIPEEELPVVFFLARQAKVSSATITDLRLQGKSWQDILNRYGYGPEILYVPVNANVEIGPPYGKAYGYYKNKPKKEWKKMKFADEDIINLVNLKFLSAHYNYPAATIMNMRQKNKGFYAIGDDIQIQREVNKKNAKAKSDSKKANAAAAKAKKKQAIENPDHLTGTKKQVDKVKKFYKKHNNKAKKYINDKG